MRKLVAVVAVVALACGGSSSGSSSAGGGSDGGPTGGSKPTGTVAGSAFAATEVVAYQATGSATAPCTLTVSGFPSVQVTMTVLALDFSSATGSCADLTSSTCHTAAPSRSVRLFVSKASIATGGATPQVPTLTAGTYTLVADPSKLPAIPLSGEVTIAAGGSTDATDACHVTSSTASGTIQITSITSTEVQGHVDVTFKDGGQLQGDFTASICPQPAPDTCAIAKSVVGEVEDDHPVDVCVSASTGSGSPYACR